MTKETGGVGIFAFLKKSDFFSFGGHYNTRLFFYWGYISALYQRKGMLLYFRILVPRDNRLGDAADS